MLILVVIRSREMDKLATFYGALGLRFTKHRHGTGPEHLTSTIGEIVFEIYPANAANESTASTRLGFSVPSLAEAVTHLRSLQAIVLSEPAYSHFGRRAVVQVFNGLKVELYERS